MLKEVYRVLNPSGIYICVSFGFPQSREGYFMGSGLNWKVSYEQVPKPSVKDLDEKSYHYIYILKKEMS